VAIRFSGVIFEADAGPFSAGDYFSAIPPDELRDRLTSWAGHTGLRLEIWALPGRALPEPAHSLVCRVLAYACDNAQAYGRATTLSVAVTAGAATVKVTVCDDGPGAVAGGGALRSLRREVRAAGGALSESATFGGGTTVRAEVPIGVRHRPPEVP
jgi:signal transduction histidine kinase